MANGVCSLDIYDDYDMLRFCRARKFVLKDIQAMFTEFMRWRKEENIDDVIDDFDFPEREQVRDNYPHGYHYTDKQGRPIYIERIGQLNVKNVFTVSTEERMIKHYI